MFGDGSQSIGKRRGRGTSSNTLFPSPAAKGVSLDKRKQPLRSLLIRFSGVGSFPVYSATKVAVFDTKLQLPISRIF